MYRDIAQRLMADIVNGHYQIKLPTEKDLMAKYDASRNTVRKAIDVVFAHGLLRRVQGSGYYIIEQPLQSQKILNMSIGFDQNAMVEGGPLKSRIVTFDEIPADGDLARRGNVEVSTPLHRVVRLRYLKEQLYDLEESYFPQTVVPYLPAEAAKNSIFAFLQTNYHMVGSSTENYIHQMALTADQASLLAVLEGDKVLTLDGINYLANGDVFNFSRTFFVYPDLTLYYHTTNIDLEH